MNRTLVLEFQQARREAGKENELEYGVDSDEQGPGCRGTRAGASRPTRRTVPKSQDKREELWFNRELRLLTSVVTSSSAIVLDTY